MPKLSQNPSNVSSRGRAWLYSMYAAYGVDLYLDYALFAAFVLFAYDGGAFEAAALAVIFTAPSIFLGPILGAVLSGKNTGAFVTLSALAIGAMSVAMWLVEGASWYIILALIRASARLSYKIALPVLVSKNFRREEYAVAHSRLQGILNIGKVIGPALAGVVLLRFGHIGLIVSSNLLAAILLMTTLRVYFSIPERSKLLDRPKRSNAFRGGRHPITSIRLSLRSLTASRVARVGAIAFVLSTVALYISDDLLALLFKHYRFTPEDVAFAITIIGAGGIAGSLIAERLIRFFGALNLFLLAILSDTLCFGIYGFGLSLVDGDLQYLVAAGTVGLMGFGVGLGAVGFGVLVQEEVPARLVAPVTASANAIGSALALTGPVVGAVLIDLISIEFPFQATAVLMAAALISSAVYAVRLQSPASVRKAKVHQ